MQHLPTLREAHPCRIIPVITIENVEDAIPLAKALLQGGMPIMEITLRTPIAIEAIRTIRHAVPEMILGAGTISSVQQAEAAIHAGSSFLISPGFCPTLAAGIKTHTTAYLPGVVTPSEVMQARNAGFSLLKFFPAEPSGGAERLKLYATLFPDVHFCPTGGISPKQVPDYWKCPNVSMIGGSWLTPKNLIAEGQWDAISKLAREAVALCPV